MERAIPPDRPFIPPCGLRTGNMPASSVPVPRSGRPIWLVDHTKRAYLTRLALQSRSVRFTRFSPGIVSYPGLIC